jgi:hypothetical protein
VRVRVRVGSHRATARARAHTTNLSGHPPGRLIQPWPRVAAFDASYARSIRGRL